MYKFDYITIFLFVAGKKQTVCARLSPVVSGYCEAAFLFTLTKMPG
ncbi:hypothetical protein AB434_1576 [Heyndrickxia coagulans]|uniref:Uncharacterized protein n=1 Tax=Heyndrickxia coagulans TaxID=1398 RepID=A0AAN0WDX8_HEYCO|nr:hypothetical protein SB48_HM08orf05990 [Heyndrickxia coagulans]AKN53981.1 hypothetical protein AB434_1576 [Heyndrickxia coagulans]KYC61960.1 hypothetical protein B4100_1023 [Heyndrickxia coagulans]KYC91338.1 hypothetical protein B4096_0975 [Heyndrickxia coagulans]